MVFLLSLFSPLPAKHTARTVSSTEVERIFRKLSSQLPKKYQKIYLKITSTSPKCDAYASYGTIKIHSSCFKSEKIVAFILGHELGHHVLGHVRIYEDSSYLQEWDADLFGLLLYMRAGYTSKNLIKELKKVIFTQNKNSKSHGKTSKRLKNIKSQIKYLENYFIRDK